MERLGVCERISEDTARVRVTAYDNGIIGTYDREHPVTPEGLVPPWRLERPLRGIGDVVEVLASEPARD